MTRDKCPAAVEVLLGHYADEGELIECDLDAGHDDPRRAIGSLEVLPYHRAELDEVAYNGVQAPGTAGTPVRIVITWLTPPDPT